MAALARNIENRKRHGKRTLIYKNQAPFSRTKIASHLEKKRMTLDQLLRKVPSDASMPAGFTCTTPPPELVNTPSSTPSADECPINAAPPELDNAPSSTSNADECPTNATDDTPLPPTGWMDFENQFVYGTQHKKEEPLWLSDSYADTTIWGSNNISVDHLRIFHQISTNEIPTAPSMSTPSLSSGSSSSQSSAMTIPTSFLVSTLDETKVPEQPTRPYCVQRAKKLQNRRFTVEQTKELETWLLNHSSYPYPHHKEKQRLAICTGLSVPQVESWLSRARSRKLTRNSPFQKRLPTTTSVPEEPPSQSSLQPSPWDMLNPHCLGAIHASDVVEEVPLFSQEYVLMSGNSEPVYNINHWTPNTDQDLIRAQNSSANAQLQWQKASTQIIRAGNETPHDHTHSPACSASFGSPSTSTQAITSKAGIRTGHLSDLDRENAIIIEPKTSENSEASTYVAPPKVNGESITSSLSTLVNAVVLVQRLNRTRPSKLDEAASPPVNGVPAAASRPSFGDTLETQSGRGTNME